MATTAIIGEHEWTRPDVVDAGRASSVTWHRPDALGAADRAAWAALAAASSEPNVFAEPPLVSAGSTISGTDPCTLAFVHDQDGVLLAVAPITARNRFGRLRAAHSALWGHSNAFLHPLLVRRGAEAAIWSPLLDALAAETDAGAFLLLDNLPADSAITAALRRHCAMQSIPLIVERRTQRAMLCDVTDAAAYWDGAVRPKKRKELRRQWARLAEQGQLTVDTLTSDAPVSAWADEFLALERSGWKGVDGSALASEASTAAFFHRILAAAHTAGTLAAIAIRIDGRAIAMLCTLTAGEGGFSYKTAYDEAFARFSPGVLLQRENLTLMGERGLAWVDSCAAEDHPMIDSLWRGRREILTLTLPLPGTANRMRFGAIQIAKTGWHRAKHLVRSVKVA